MHLAAIGVVTVLQDESLSHKGVAKSSGGRGSDSDCISKVDQALRSQRENRECSELQRRDHAAQPLKGSIRGRHKETVGREDRFDDRLYIIAAR